MAREELKVMKRIEPREAAIEGVVTRHGTLVGPVMTELTGYPELTPYGGGWCGNDIHPGVLTAEHRRQARLWTEAFGERLRAEGYRGYFELDFLVDAVSGEMYLGDSIPRHGCGPMTNVSQSLATCRCSFHLEADVDYGLDAGPEPSGPGPRDGRRAQYVMKDVDDRTELITVAPTTGIWRMAGDGTVTARRDTDWHDLTDECEGTSDRRARYRYPPDPGSW
jgi:hypothetical protein